MPGAVTLKGNINLTEALAKAGSPTPDAGSYIEINRRPRENTGSATTPTATDGAKPAPPERISMADLQSGRAQNIMLADGDTVFVPKGGDVLCDRAMSRMAGPSCTRPA